MNWQLARGFCAVAVSALSLQSVAMGWTSRGHQKMTLAAVEVLDESLPSLSAEARSLLVRASMQPDVMRPGNLMQLRDIEASRHYLDLELLAGAELPLLLSDYVELIARLADQPDNSIGRGWQNSTVGVLPYALIESSQRLATLFAQLRRLEGDQELMAMAMVEAGHLAHYAQDLCQPLHTTVHHDGRVGTDGRAASTGIHRLVDGLPSRLPAAAGMAELRGSRALGQMFEALMEALLKSHSQVDRVYFLEEDLMALQAGEAASPAVEAFMQERFACAVNLTADLIHTSWDLSVAVELPEWAVVGVDSD